VLGVAGRLLRRAEEVAEFKELWLCKKASLTSYWLASAA
jgi:hypothetical protein